MDVLVFQHIACEPPGVYEDVLYERGVELHRVEVDAHEPLPSWWSFDAIVAMGGPMSANDALPWIEPLCGLLRRAVDARVPVVGHCLGGQLFSRALGGSVTRSPVPEIGWVDVEAEDESARAWFGGCSRFTTFEWHYDTFAIPPGARRLLRNEFVANQAYVVDDLHVGFQCHVEMTDALVRSWCDVARSELPASSTGNLQSAADIERDLAGNVRALQQVAGAFYDRWARGLRGVRTNALELASIPQA